MSASERLKAKKKGNVGKQVNKVRDVSVMMSQCCHVINTGRRTGRRC